MSRLVVLWVHLVTAAAPPAPRSRRREEIAAHLNDALAAGVTPWQLFRATGRGAYDDLRWCSEERVRAGWPPLLIGPVGSTVIAGICMVGTFLAAMEGLGIGSPLLRSVLPAVAAVVLLASYIHGFWARARKRSRRVDDPIFP